jgi:hypothetical protein
MWIHRPIYAGLSYVGLGAEAIQKKAAWMVAPHALH